MSAVSSSAHGYRSSSCTHAGTGGPCGFVKVGGVDVHLVDVGDGPAVVLVHGGQAWAYAWRNQVQPLLRAGYRVVVPDLPGSGYSGVDATDLSISSLSRCLADLLNALGIERAAFVASSEGGLPVLDLAIRQPERVRALVLASTCGVPHALPPLWRLVIRPPLLGEIAGLLLGPRLVRENLEQAFHSSALVTAEMVDAYLKPLRRPGVWAAQLRMERCSRPAFVEANLERISAPAIVVWGENDRWHPVAMAREFGRQLSAARVEVLTACGHLPHEERPDDFNRLLLNFLATTGDPPGTH